MVLLKTILKARTGASNQNLEPERSTGQMGQPISARRYGEERQAHEAKATDWK